MSPTSEPAPRTDMDRRRKPTRFWDAFRHGGRRVRNRRTVEHCRAYFVDRFTTPMFALIILLIAFTIVDAVFTLQLLGLDCEEVNPAMDYLLRHGHASFLIGKYLLTVAGLPFLLLFKNYYLFGTRLRVGHLIPIFAGLYVALIGYQLHLFRTLQAG